MRAAALRSALASKASIGAVWVLDGFTEPKTKAATTALKAAGIEGRILVVVNSDDEGAGNVHKAFRNLAGAAFSYDKSLSTYEVLLADNVIFTANSLDAYVGSGEKKEGASA
jgi:large subunit ribosomal protein L4